MKTRLNGIHGYLAHENLSPPRTTIAYGYCRSPRVGLSLMSEVPLYLLAVEFGGALLLVHKNG